MKHLDDGTLRRMQDEPLAVSAVQQQHYDRCEVCRSQASIVESEAHTVEQLLSLPPLTPVTEGAFVRLWSAVEREERAHPVRRFERWFAPPMPPMRRMTAPVIAVAVAAALLVGFTGYEVAPRLVTIFHPTRIVPVVVTPGALPRGATLEYGTLTWIPAPPQFAPAASLGAAAGKTGLPALVVGSLPAAAGSSVTYETVDAATAVYVFDAEELATSAAKQGITVKPMPAAINGSTLFVDTGPSLLTVYGPSPVAAPSEAPTASGAGAGILDRLPVLVIAETRAPTARASGASATELEDYLLSQPGVPPDVAAQLRAIKDPASALPIPIFSGLTTSKPAQVQGVAGVLVDAGIAAGVIWQKGGIIYAVGGQLTPDQILQVARSLH